MHDALTTFFNAWAETDAAARLSMITEALAPGAVYSDPRSGGRFSDLDMIAEYVGHFSANAPGWSATVESADVVNDYAKAIVNFGGPGPDGEPMGQVGTYFAEANADGQIVQLVGFAG